MRKWGRGAAAMAWVVLGFVIAVAVLPMHSARWAELIGLTVAVLMIVVNVAEAVLRRRRTPPGEPVGDPLLMPASLFLVPIAILANQRIGSVWNSHHRAYLITSVLLWGAVPVMQRVALNRGGAARRGRD